MVQPLEASVNYAFFIMLILTHLYNHCPEETTIYHAFVYTHVSRIFGSFHVIRLCFNPPLIQNTVIKICVSFVVKYMCF